MISKIDYEGESVTYPFNYLLATAQYHVEFAQGATQNALYPSLAALLASAFALEAVVNHVGAARVPNWSTLERKLSPTKKLEVIAPLVGMSLDWSRSPAQDYRALFNLRNKWVHGKTITKKVKFRAPPGDPTHSEELKPRWVTACTPENAHRNLRHAVAITTTLLQGAGLMRHLGAFRQAVVRSRKRRAP